MLRTNKGISIANLGCGSMRLLLPDIARPLEAIGCCARFSLDERQNLADLFPTSGKTEEIIHLDVSDDPRILRLLLERLNGSRVHFHFDVVRARIFKNSPVPSATSSAEAIQEKFDRITGSKMNVELGCRFRIAQPDLPKNSTINLFASIGMNLDGVGASLAGATLRLTGSVFRELKWTTVGTKEPTLFAIELTGTRAQQVIGDDLLILAEREALLALDRFVLAKRSDERHHDKN